MNPFEVLQKNSLFAGLADAQIEQVLREAGAHTERHQKGETLIREGAAVSEIGIILTGRARSVEQDAQGRTQIVAAIRPGGFAGVLLAGSRGRKSPVTVEAMSALTLVWIPFDGLVACSANLGPTSDLLVRNLLDSIAGKAMELQDRIQCLIRHTVREKITVYLERVAEETGRREFDIPFDRAAMAEYLNVERSALSRELSRMRADGLLTFERNHFRLP